MQRINKKCKLIELSCEMVKLTRTSLEKSFGFTVIIFGHFQLPQNLLVSM
jgi:hypothetical protein